VKSFELAEVPVRCAKFITRKQWFVAGTDDMKLRVYNYNTSEKVKEWDAHTDYIRFVEIHPNRPYILRSVLSTFVLKIIIIIILIS
jgi:coatomer subunit beta'